MVTFLCSGGSVGVGDKGLGFYCEEVASDGDKGFSAGLEGR